MALPILDGNQSAATLSTIITGGAHIPAHTVVSLGSQAISDITSGVSGSVVSISNFPASQSTTFGAVTGSVSVLNFPASQSVTFTQAQVTFGVVSASVSVLNFPASQTVTVGNFPASQTVAGTVTVGGFSSVSIGSGALLAGGKRSGAVEAIPLDSATGYLQTKVESMPSISGTVSATVTVGVVSQGCFGATIQGYDTITGVTFSNCVPVKIFEDATGVIGDVAGTVTANVGAVDQFALKSALDEYAINYNNPWPIKYANTHEGDPFPISGTVTVGNSVTIGSIPAISGTVTANNPNGALTTRFGSVTTANTAQITSAVTNTNRKYLLAQNISAGTVTIGIGFSPTTTQGIQLPAGGGLTFDAFCPTGAVYWLGAVTGAAYTILEG